jgi:hypothetical protein
MRKILFGLLIAVAVVGANGVAFGQTKQEKKQISLLEREISSVQNEIQVLRKRLASVSEAEISSVKTDIDSLRALFSRSTDPKLVDKYSKLTRKRQKELSSLEIKAAGNMAIEKELSALNDKLANLQHERDFIFSQYAATPDVPKEMLKIEQKRRLRSNVVRREELVLEKIENNLGKVEPSGNKAGYKVILDNQYHSRITFKIVAINGGDIQSSVVDSRKKETIYLLPGSYTVSFFNGGTQIGNPRSMTIDGRTHTYLGEECFNFAYMPRW